MPEKWLPLPLDKQMYANANPDAVIGLQTAIENGYLSDQGVQSRFPGLTEFCTLKDNGRVILHDFNGDLMAGTSNGRLYRIDKSARVESVPGVAISGGRRIVFAKTDRELLMAAGGPILRLRNSSTELLSKGAPLSTHVGWIDGYTIAVETNSGRFYHSGPGEPASWNSLDTFAADGNPDNINAMLISPYREIMLGGQSSIEQFERLPTGSVPFFRRWTIGDGVKFPYCIVFADNAIWTINQLTELVRLSGQQSQAASAEFGQLFESIDNWRDAWLGGYPDRAFHIAGQKFLLLQAPYATNEYGTKGVTLLYDYRQQRFSALYGWDKQASAPARWPGWSHWTLWNKVFIGGEGKIYVADVNSFANGDQIQRWLVRTAHLSQGGGFQVKDLRLRVRRGTGSPSAASSIRVRCSRDGRPFGAWISRSLGKAGQREQFISFGGFGNADHVMFEISSSESAPIDLMKAEILAEPVGH